MTGAMIGGHGWGHDWGMAGVTAGVIAGEGAPTLPRELIGGYCLPMEEEPSYLQVQSLGSHPCVSK